MHRAIFTTGVLTLWLFSGWMQQAAWAQVSLQRKAPAGYEALVTRSVVQRLHLAGEAQDGIELVVRTQATQNVQAGDAVVVSRHSVRALVHLLTLQGLHPRAARAWAEQAEFKLGQSSCLPLLDRADCLPVALVADAEGRIQLQKGDAQRRDPGQSDNAISLLGSAYASAGWEPGRPGVTVGLSTQGLLSSRETYLEYDLLAGNARAAQGITPNLLTAGTLLNGDLAVHGGLFRAGGIGGEASAMRFFVRPRLLGVTLRSDGRMLKSGEQAQVRFTLLAPARVTISSNGVQLYSALLGMGEQVVTLPGRPGNFVDVRTEQLGAEAQTFQAAVFGSESSETKATWRWELGQTVADHGTVPGRHVSRVLMTTARVAPWKGLTWQAAFQAGSSGAMRWGLSVAPRQGRWGLGATVGQQGEWGLSGLASGRLAGLVDASVNHSRYRAPSWHGTPSLNPCFIDRTLCYSSRSYSQTGLFLGLVDLPLSLTLNATRSGATSLRQSLLRASIPIQIGSTTARIQMGLRQMHPSGDRAVFAFLTLALGASGTTVSSSLSVQRDGRSDLSASYSMPLSDVWDAPASISQSVSGGTGPGSSPPSFYHQFNGHAGPVSAHLSSSHGGLGQANFSASASAHYGVSKGELAFTRYMPVLGGSSLAPTSMAALQVVNDSADEQMVVLGMQTVAVPAGARMLIPAQMGHAPLVNLAPGPVVDAQRLAMPTYLFAGNIHQIHVPSGGWRRVRFLGRPPGAAERVPLRATHVRNRPDGEELRIYQDAQAYAFIFDPLVEGPAVRYLTVHGDRSSTSYRCQAEGVRNEDVPGVYPEMAFLCDAESEVGSVRRP